MIHSVKKQYVEKADMLIKFSREVISFIILLHNTYKGSPDIETNNTDKACKVIVGEGAVMWNRGMPDRWSNRDKDVSHKGT